ncbi:MAG: NB-ARC domain-containing protein [Pseudomonadota bacterium]
MGWLLALLGDLFSIGSGSATFLNRFREGIRYPAIEMDLERGVVGREDDLRRLRAEMKRSRKLSEPSRGAIVWGEGGWGKSTLARYYANRTQRSYGGGLWVSAASRADAMEALVGFGAAAFDIPARGEGVPLSFEQHVKPVLQKISAARQRLLFIFDNVEDLEDIRDLLPHGRKIDLILTTRTSKQVPGFYLHEIETLPVEDMASPAVSLLLQEAGASGQSSRKPAFELAKEVGGMPLALVLAGALVRNNADGVQSFETIRAEIAGFVRGGAEYLGDYPDGLAAALKLSMDRLSREARGVANVCAWWAAEGLEPRLFYEAPGGQWWRRFKGDLPEQWHGFLGDASAITAAFSELRDLSMLRGEGGGPQAMHRMTATVLRAAQGDHAERYARAAAVLLMVVYPGGSRNPLNPDTWSECRVATPHGMALWSKAGAEWRWVWGQPAWASMDTLLNQCGLFFNSQENRAEEIVAKRGSLEIKEASYEETARDIPLALGSLGTALSEIGDFEEAETLLDRAVALDWRDRLGTADHIVTLTQRAGLEMDRDRAGASDTGADLAKADHLLEAAREFAEEPVRGHSDALKANVAHNIGLLRSLQGRRAEAAEAFEWALALTPPGASNRADRAALAMNTGATWLEVGLPERSEPLLREAYETRKEIFAETPGHSRLRSAAGWLAGCLLVLDRRDGTRDREAEARELHAVTGTDWNALVDRANSLPLTPEEAAAPPD